jgi:hypothetical protein
MCKRKWMRDFKNNFDAIQKFASILFKRENIKEFFSPF